MLRESPGSSPSQFHRSNRYLVSADRAACIPISLPGRDEGQGGFLGSGPGLLAFHGFVEFSTLESLPSPT